MQLKQWISCAACALGAVAAWGQKYSNEFLSIGVGARAHGMGNAVVASVDDVTSGYWNPAGLAGIQSDMQVGAMHAEWFGGIGKYDYVSFGMPIPNQSRYAGFSFVRFGVDGIPNTLSLYEADGTINYNNVTEFSASDYAFMFHYAQRFDSIGLSIGASPKIVYRHIGKFANSWGFGVDLSAQYKLNKNWSFGVLLRDITTTFNAWRFSFTEAEKQTLGLTGNEIPIKSLEITRPKILLGASYRKDFALGKGKEGKQPRTMGILAEADFQITTDGKRNVLLSASPFSVDPVAGLELHYNRVVYLRSGVNNIQRIKNQDNTYRWAVQPNFGVGFRIYKFAIDYAITNLGGGSGALYSHLVSLRFDLDFKYFKRAIEEEQ